MIVSCTRSIVILISPSYIGAAAGIDVATEFCSGCVEWVDLIVL
jgi:hypothetical protein